MINIGDTVRYLNSVGGGVVTRIDGKIAYVDDNGFETPFQIKELVVVLPAGHEKPSGGTPHVRPGGFRCRQIIIPPSEA